MRKYIRTTVALNNGNNENDVGITIKYTGTYLTNGNETRGPDRADTRSPTVELEIMRRT